MIMTYDAVDTKGRPASDRIEASTTSEAIDLLRNRGLFVTRIAAESPAKLGLLGRRKTPREARIPLTTLVILTRQLAMLLRAGSGIVPALSAIKRQMNKPAHAAILTQIASDLEEGSTLTDALRKHPRSFSPIYCAVIAAGEASATLTEMFERLALMVGRQRTMRNKVLGALAYPALLIGMCFHIILGLLFFVLPRFNDMFTQLGVETPASTKLMLSTAGILSAYWPALLVGTITLIGLLFMALTSDAGRQWMSNFQTKPPVIGKLRSRLLQALVFRTMGMLLEARVGVLESLELIRDSTRNDRFQKLFADLENTVTSGGRASTAFEQSGFVEPYICQAIHTGEDAGNIGFAMTFCADMLDESNTELINTTVKLIEPLILIGLGIVVGFVAISLFLPLFDLTSAIG